jgi:hypothetical protein
VDSEDSVRRVVEFDGAFWVVRALAGERVSLRAPDRGTAVARAKEIVRHLGGGQVAIREKGGEKETVLTVPRAARRRRR